MRIAIITDKPIHYRVDFFNALAVKFQNDISFYFILIPRSTEKNRISIFQGEPFHRHATFFYEKHILLRYTKFLRTLLNDKPDVIVNTGMSPRVIWLVLYSKLFRKRLAVWWGGTEQSESGVSRLKKMYRKILISVFDGAVCYSQLASNYLFTLRRHAKNVFVLGNNTFDSSKYYDMVSTLRRDKEGERCNQITLLTVSYLLPSKNIGRLLRVYQRLRNKFSHLGLFIVGDGPARHKLEKYCFENRIPSVSFEGFANPQRLPYYYAKADIFVIPTLLDRWPQTYNEAASSALPIVISRKAGILNDYVERYRAQVVFDPDTEAQLEALLEALITKPFLREHLGKEALKEALHNDCNRAVTTFSDCIDSIFRGTARI